MRLGLDTPRLLGRQLRLRKLCALKTVPVRLTRFRGFLAGSQNALHVLDVVDDGVESVLHVMDEDIAIIFPAVAPYGFHQGGIDLLELFD